MSVSAGKAASTEKREVSPLRATEDTDLHESRAQVRDAAEGEGITETDVLGTGGVREDNGGAEGVTAPAEEVAGGDPEKG